MCEILFKVNSKDTFTHYSGISIVDFEQVNAGWLYAWHHPFSAYAELSEKLTFLTPQPPRYEHLVFRRM